MKAKSSTSAKTRAKYDHRATLEAVDNYTNCVLAVLALINELRFDANSRTLRPEVRYGVGRRMTTSPSNLVSPLTQVTPDLVVQDPTNRGTVGEAKLGLPQNTDYWEQDFKQLIKYDDDLSGWWTTPIGHDVVALVPLSRAKQFAKRMQVAHTFRRPFAVVGFDRVSRVEDFILLQKTHGDVSDRALSERLDNTHYVGLQWLTTYTTKLLDHMPPMPYLLQIIWDNLFSSMAFGVAQSSRDGSITLNVHLSDLTTRLQDYFGTRSSGDGEVEIPKRQWVHQALDALVTFGRAKRLDQSLYAVVYKRSRGGDTLKLFGRLCFDKLRPNGVGASKGQLALKLDAPGPAPT